MYVTVHGSPKVFFVVAYKKQL